MGYCGTLGSSYNIPLVIDALSIMDSNCKDVPTLIVMGDGPKFINYKNYASKKTVKAVFTGRIPYDEMCGVLSRCDFVINPIRKGSAASIINKHADYAACGKAVVNTQDSNEYKELVENWDMGISCSSIDEVVQAISMLNNSEELRSRQGQNARRCAESMFDRKNTYLKLVDEICNYGERNVGIIK